VSAKNCLLIIVLASLVVVGCTREQAYEPQPVFATAGMDFAQRPVRDFLINQGTYCVPDGTGGCGLIHPPTPNYLCWCDDQTGWMASLDYAAVAENWLHLESSGTLSCGTQCLGQVIEVPQPDGTARVSVILQTKGAMTWAEKEKPAGMDLGVTPDAVLRGKSPTLGIAKLELEFGIPYPGAPLPDLMQLIYDPAAGQELYRIAFHGQAQGTLRGKATLMTVREEGLSPGIPTSAMAGGLPAEVTLTVMGHRSK